MWPLYVTLEVGLDMATIRTHVIFEADILRDIDSLVGKRGRSAFLADAAKLEIQRRKILQFLERKEPAWKIANHPELKQGAAAWVSNMRRDDERTRAASRK